jgi:flavoprotein
MVTVADDVYLMMVDSKVQAVDLGPMMRRHRAAYIEVCADAIDQAADLMMDEAFDLEQTWDACEASGMPSGAIDSAGNVALALRQVEQLGQ